jgi:hypothetical protein
MSDVLDGQAEVLNFREEARACLQLARAEALNEVRTILTGMAIGWLKFAHDGPQPLVKLSAPMTVEEDDYYTLMAQAIAALDPNTGDARRRLYERARAALLTELRNADPSDIMAAQMLLELAIGEVEAGAQRDQYCAPSTASPPTVPARERSVEARSPAGACHSAISRPRPLAEKFVTRA